VISKPDPIDIHVGSRVRLRRALLGMSQEKLGNALGLTFQQIQKYERGANRIGSSRLFKLSKTLDVPASFFFEEISEETERNAKGLLDQKSQMFETEQLLRHKPLELVRGYYRITDPKVKKRMLEFVKAVGYSDNSK
jgi:transcriptional regulator with XRE-family HTH domain